MTGRLFLERQMMGTLYYALDCHMIQRLPYLGQNVYFKSTYTQQNEWKTN